MNGACASSSVCSSSRARSRRSRPAQTSPGRSTSRAARTSSTPSSTAPAARSRAVEQITDMGRVSAITAFRDRLAVSNALGTGSDRLELARLDRNPVLPGRLVDSAGQLPVYSPRGKLLFTRPRYARQRRSDRHRRLRRARRWLQAASRAARCARTPTSAGARAGGSPPCTATARGSSSTRAGGIERTVRVPLKRIARFRTNVHGQMYAFDGEGNVARDRSRRRQAPVQHDLDDRLRLGAGRQRDARRHAGPPARADVARRRLRDRDRPFRRRLSTKPPGAFSRADLYSLHSVA